MTSTLEFAAQSLAGLDLEPRLRLVTSTAEFAALKSGWDRLTDDPLQSFAWNFAWWMHMSQDAELHLYCLEQDGELLAVAPLYRDRWLSLDRLRFLGSGNTCTDYVQLIGDPQFAATFAGLIEEDLAEGGLVSVVEFEGVTEDFPEDTFHQSLRSNRWSYQKAIQQSWVLELPSHWDAFFESCPKSLKRKIRNSQKRIESSECCVRSTLDGLALPEAIGVLVELHQMRFVEKGEAGVFSDAGFTAFLTQAITELAKTDKAEILVAYSGDEPIAAHLLLHTPRGPQYYQGGIHTGRLKLEPGHLLFAYAIRRAVQQGHAVFDFLRGNEPYKQFWRATPKPLWTVRYVSRSPKASVINRLFVTLRSLRNTVFASQ